MQLSSECRKHWRPKTAASATRRDVAMGHPEVISQIAAIMNTAATPSDRYPIGRIYKGKPLWSPGKSVKK